MFVLSWFFAGTQSLPILPYWKPITTGTSGNDHQAVTIACYYLLSANGGQAHLNSQKVREHFV
jgi:hypothetical protein